jgi:single-strand DNA-binding protein
MKGNNFVLLQGHLGVDPEERFTPDQQRVVKLRLATNHFKKDAGGEREKITNWHSVDVWGKTAEFCARYLQKGDRVQILGSIRNRVVEKDGKKQTYSSVSAWEVNVLTPFDSRTPRPLASAVGNGNGEAQATGPASVADAIPF